MEKKISKVPNSLLRRVRSSEELGLFVAEVYQIMVTWAEREFLEPLEFSRSLCGPFLLGLKGDLGTGKTTLVRAFVNFLEEKGSCRTQVTSPTFSLHHRYNFLKGLPFCQPSPPSSHRMVIMDHWDLYRVTAQEIEGTGFWESLEDLGKMTEGERWCFVEWPQDIKEDLESLAKEQNFTLGEIEILQDEGGKVFVSPAISPSDERKFHPSLSSPEEGWESRSFHFRIGNV